MIQKNILMSYFEVFVIREINKVLEVETHP